MSGTHTTTPPADKALTARPDTMAVLNSSKVVRLFVVNEAAGETVAKVQAAQSTTRADVFVIVTRDPSARGAKPRLVAKSIGKKDVVDHEKAHHEDKGSVVVLKADDGDQIEWQCDVEFYVSRIEMSADGDHIGFPPHGQAPENPFIKELDQLRSNEPGQPIRSGGLKQLGRHWKQLYKAHFMLKIDDDWQPLDPDFFCEGR